MADPRRASTGHTTAQRPVMGPPETPSRVMQPSPNMFPTLQFSPDLFSNSPFMPTTAPIYPQQRLFWDPNIGTVDPSTGLPQYQDCFAYPDDFHDSFASTSTVMPSFHPSRQLPSQQEYDLPPVSRPMASSYIDGAHFPQSFQTSPRVPPHREDNPSMFLSSPARRFENQNPPRTLLPSTAIREKPAYHHQIEESRREKELKRSRKTSPRHPSVTRSVMEALRRPVSPVKDSRPGLKRSLTHSGVGGRQPQGRQQSHVSFLDNLSHHSGSTNRSRNGRTSPLKSLAEGINRQNSSSRASNRTSVTLAIDENGVAKTVISKVPEVDEMDLDDDSSESDLSSRDDNDFIALRSQQNSFAYADDDEPVQSYGSQNRLQGHSKSSSHSTMASNNSNWQSSRTSSTTSRNITQNRVPSQRKPQRVDNEVNMLDPNAGDAQQALRAIIQDRSRSTSANDSVQFNSSPPIQQTHYSTFNISPTTITDPDLATPSTDRGSFTSNGSTRCICNSNGNDPSAAMIQW